MSLINDLNTHIDEFFKGGYYVTEGRKVPDVDDIQFGKEGTEIELAMLFIDIRESTKIVDNIRRITAARMYKSFLYGVAAIARSNNGQLRSFNGDGVLVAFYGDTKRSNAAKSALQMSWFVNKILKPKMDNVFLNNIGLSSEQIDFDYGIGIDAGKILVVRGGIRGENNNDLVWVGNATNYAVKLSDLSSDGKHVHISEDIYSNLIDSSKYSGNPKRDMWEKDSWTSMNNMLIYRSNWTWEIS